MIRMGGIKRCWKGVISIGVLTLLLGAVSAGPQVDVQSVDSDSLHVAFTTRMFPETNKSDAKAAIKVWAETVAGSRGLQVKARTEVYEDLQALRKALIAGEADLVSVRVDEFLDTDLHQHLEPVFVGVKGKKAAEQFLVLGQTSRQDEELAALQGRSMVMLDSGRTGMSRVWLDAQLLEAGLPESRIFFSEVYPVAKLSQAVLPVFFGQRDVCLVPKSGFEIMCEMNSQVGRSLVALRASPLLLPSLMCLRRDYQAKERGEILRALEELHLDSRGRQVLMLFKLDRLVRYSEQHLVSARKVLKECQRLRSTSLATELSESASVPVPRKSQTRSRESK